MLTNEWITEEYAKWKAMNPPLDVRNFTVYMSSFIAPRAKCYDGLQLSIQASSFHYCCPKVTGCQEYKSVEVGYPSERIEALMPYAENPKQPTNTVYPFVDVELLDDILREHGGIVGRAKSL